MGGGFPRLDPLSEPILCQSIPSHPVMSPTHSNPFNPALSPQGVEYLKTERARLERMISSGSVAAAKLDEMTRKSSVLEAFAGEEAKAAEEEDDDDDKVDEE